MITRRNLRDPEENLDESEFARGFNGARLECEETVGTGGLSPRIERLGRETDPLHLVPGIKMTELYFHYPTFLHYVMLS
jgi:hypothetical protein